MVDIFWFNDAQWAVLEPLLPHLGGKRREEHWRVLSGIVYHFREGLRWRPLPDAHGPHMAHT